MTGDGYWTITGTYVFGGTIGGYYTYSGQWIEGTRGGFFTS